MQLDLKDIEAHLFPEYFPLNHKLFTAERIYLRNPDPENDIAFQNISFKFRLIKQSLKIKNHKVREYLYFLFYKIFSNTFNYDKSYDWKDLKLILCFLILFSDVKGIKDIESRARQAKTTMLMRKYYGLILKEKLKTEL